VIGPFGADEIELAVAIHPCSEAVKSHVAAVKISKSEFEAADTCATETGEEAATSKNGGAETGGGGEATAVVEITTQTEEEVAETVPVEFKELPSIIGWGTEAKPEALHLLLLLTY